MDKMAMLRKAMEAAKSGKSEPKAPDKSKRLSGIAKELRAAMKSEDDDAFAAALKSFMVVAKEE